MAIAESGFEAIQPPVPQAPYARRKIVRGEDGTPQVILIDMQGNVISDPSGYGIVESGSYLNPNLGTATLDVKNPKPESEKNLSTAQTVIRDSARGERDNDSSSGASRGRSAANNFGYVNKPGFMGATSMLPGPAGMISKGVNAAVNANNVAAVNSARNMMGLEGTGIGGAVKGTLRDNKGQVADVSIGGSTYATPVGLEALSPSGMTNMTPAEAMARAQATGGLTLSTPEAIRARDEAFEAEFGKPGILSRIANVATNFVDSLFGSPGYAAPDPDFSPTQSGFSDMLSGRGGGGSSSQSYGSGTAGGFSPSGIGAARAADRDSVAGYSGGNGGNRSESAGYGGGYGGPGGSSTSAGNSMGHGGIGSA